MLTLNNLGGFGGKRQFPLSLIQTTGAADYAFVSTTGNPLTYSASMDIGALNKDKYVLVVNGCRNSVTLDTTAVTVDGVAATELADSQGPNIYPHAVWLAKVPNSAGAVTVTATMSSTSFNRFMYTVAFAAPSGLITKHAQDQSGTVTGFTSSSLIVPKGGLLFGCTCTSNAWSFGAINYTNVTKKNANEFDGVGHSLGFSFNSSPFSGTIGVSQTQTAAANFISLGLAPGYI